ncbi:hypothetical protein D9M73_156670 [compost metagenome]
MRVVVLVQRRCTAIGDGQPGLDFLGIRHEQTLVGVLQQFRRKAGLCFNDEIALDQARQELIHRAVAQAPIERAIAWIANRIAGAGFELIVQ